MKRFHSTDPGPKAPSVWTSCSVAGDLPISRGCQASLGSFCGARAAGPGLEPSAQVRRESMGSWMDEMTPSFLKHRTIHFLQHH